MPSASTAKVEKQVSTEALEPLKQALVIIEHKIRNLEKRKGRLDSYKDLQKNGNQLHNDQLLAVSKYDEVVQTLEFARDLYKQFLGISNETSKQQKKQARKEALEKTQQEIAKFKEILIIQDVLANMGQDNVREDFLAGRNGALTLTEEDLQQLDDIFVEVSPKRDIEEGLPPFTEQTQKAAEHLVSLVDGKNKDFVGTTYAKLKEQIAAINACGYFDQSAPGASPPVDAPVAEEVAAVEEAPVPEEEPEQEEIEAQVVQSATFQSMPTHIVENPAVVPIVETAGQYIAQLPINDVISSVMSSVTGSLNFIQESELESPDVGVAQVQAQPVTIPTQTFTNANFTGPPVIPAAAQPPYPHQHQQAPAGYTPIPMPPSQQQQQQALPLQQPPPQQPPQQHIQQPAPPQPQPTQQQVVFSNQPPPAQTFPTQQQQQQITNQFSPNQQPAQQFSPQPSSFQHSVESTDWSESTEQNSEWNMPVEQPSTDSWVDQTESEWNEQPNDGFVQAGGRGGGGRLGRGGNRNDRGRGGRDGGYSGPRNNRGNYNNQNGRGGSGGNYYRNNSEGGGGNFYQNGFQSGGGYKRTGNRGGAGGAPRQDRGGPRGGGGGRGGGSNNPRSNRGNRQ